MQSYDPDCDFDNHDVGEGGRNPTLLIQRLILVRGEIFPLTNIVIGEAKTETQR